VTTATTIRRLCEADIDALFALCIERDIEELGEATTTREEVAVDLAAPTRQTVGVDDPAGGLAGYAWCEYVDGHRSVWADVVVHRTAPPQLAATLLGWVRETAAAAASRTPVWLFADDANQTKVDLLKAAGGVAIRRFFRMGIDFTAGPKPQVVALAEGIAIRGIDGGEDELRTVHRVVDTAFLDHFGHEPMTYDYWRRMVPDGMCPDLSLYWLATVDGQPAAAVYCSTMHGRGHIDTLGTLREHRGRGLGRALLLTAFAEFDRRGLHRVTLGVDASSPTGAVALYESAGMTVLNQGCRYELPPPGGSDEL
jgi:mycothiol synthase